MKAHKNDLLCVGRRTQKVVYNPVFGKIYVAAGLIYMAGY